MSQKNLEFSYLSTCNAKQAEFHLSQHPFKAFVGGFGCGKTTALIHETWMSIYRFPGTTALIGRTTYRELEDTTWKMALDLIPGPLIRKVSKEDMKIYLPNGVEILFRSMEDPHKLRSLNLGFFALDEASEIPIAYFEMLTTRLRQMNGPRKGIIASNYHGHDWIWRKFKRESHPDFFLMESSTFDNRKNLPEDYLEKLKTLPKDQYKRNVEGTFDDFDGQVFTEFDARVHVLDFTLGVDWEYKRAIDPGLNHPTVCLWYATDKEGRIYIYDEYSHSDFSAEHNAKNILFKSRQHLIEYEHPLTHEHRKEIPSIRYTVIDPSAIQRQSTSMKSVFMEYGLSGIKPLLLCARDARKIGMMRIQEYLTMRKGCYHPHFLIEPAPKLFIHPRCKLLLEQLTSFTWNDYDKKKNDDLVDALKYACVMESHPAMTRNVQDIPEYVSSNKVTGY